MRTRNETTQRRYENLGIRIDHDKRCKKAVIEILRNAAALARYTIRDDQSFVTQISNFVAELEK